LDLNGEKETQAKTTSKGSKDPDETRGTVKLQTIFFQKISRSKKKAAVGREGSGRRGGKGLIRAKTAREFGHNLPDGSCNEAALKGPAKAEAGGEGVLGA